MSKETRISITEITVLAGKIKGFKIDIDGETIVIPVDETVFTHYHNQFYRPNPTPAQRLKFSTLLSLMRAAYKKGFLDGAKSK